MGSIGGDVLSGIQTSIDKAEKNYKGLVIANEGANFSAGANVGMIFMLAIDQEYDELGYGHPDVSKYDDEGKIFFYTGCCLLRMDWHWAVPVN